MEEGTRWQLRNGESINFFEDLWLFLDKKIKDLVIRPLSTEETNSKVVQWTRFGTWDFSSLSLIMSNQVISILISIMPPYHAASCDIMLWNGTFNGSFTLKSAYFMIEKPPPILFDPNFKLIWKWKGAERICFFIWMSYHNRIPTNK